MNIAQDMSAPTHVKLSPRPGLHQSSMITWSPVMKWGPLERGDILDRGRLDNLFQQYQPSAGMHFAAHAYVGASVEHPADLL